MDYTKLVKVTTEGVKVAGVFALKMFKVGVLNTAAFSLQENARSEMRGVNGELKIGYTEHVKPKLSKKR